MARPRRQPPKEARRDAFQTALEGLKKGLVGTGIEEASADRFARLILSRPRVTIRVDGTIRYRAKGQAPKDYRPEAFATSSVADFVTGRRAERENQAAIEGDPGYLQALAELGLLRDTELSDVGDERRRSILDFGDPRFTDDPLLGAQAAANPFSVSKLLIKQLEDEARKTLQAANVAGTLFGGGYQSGQAEVRRLGAARETEATRTLEDLLADLSGRSARATAGYELGRTGALSDAEQRLLESGVIHAAGPPSLQMPTGLGSYQFWRPRRRRDKRFEIPLPNFMGPR